MATRQYRSFSSSPFFSYVILILWMVVIFSFSTMSGKETSVSLPLWYFLERKSAHVFEYAVLTLLAFRYFSQVFVRERMVRVLLVAATFSLMYGATDELHQFFVPNRGASMSDVLIDGIGISIACVGLLLFRRNKNHFK